MARFAVVDAAAGHGAAGGGGGRVGEGGQERRGRRGQRLVVVQLVEAMEERVAGEDPGIVQYNIPLHVIYDKACDCATMHHNS